MNQTVATVLSHTYDAILARLPHKAASATALAQARIVSHRGERDGVSVQENTFAAFDPAVAAGVQAIEFDIRYTRDDEPVVAHDADLKRVFGLADVIADSTWHRLNQRAPHIPHLASLIERYAPRTHLMLELKTRGSRRAEQRLADLLQPLQPKRDYHVLSLEPAFFDGVATVSRSAWLPVAKLNLRRLYAWAMTHECAGLAGPYALMRRHHIRGLKAEGRAVGSGFVNHPDVLVREIARGVEWIFSNHAVALQHALDTAREARPVS